MDKKHISIIGTCVSRNLFNTSILNDVFDIDCYICQVCSWALFDKGFSLPRETIYKINTSDFEARLLWYELCKTSSEELLKCKSEYILIDLHNIYADVTKLDLDGDCVYAQNNSGLIASNIKNIKAVNELKNLKCEDVTIDTIDKCIVLKGLQALADFLKKNYDETKVIIHIPKRVTKYCDFDNNVVDYDEAIVLKEKNYDSIVLEFSDYLKSLLPNAKVLYNFDNFISKYIPSNVTNNTPLPESNHFSDFDNIKTANKLLSLLNLNYDLFRKTPLSPIEYSLLKYNNLHLTTQKDLLLSNRNLITLNNYFDKIQNLDDIILILSAKDEASKQIKYFRNKNLINIQANIGHRESYIAIVDKLRNYIIELNSDEKITHEYRAEGHSVLIKSAGFTKGNFSSIRVDDGIELCKNQRGLNIVLLNSKTFELVDSAYCDTHAEKKLYVCSDYFSNIKIKVESK